MKLTPGELYFIGERDHLTGIQTPYYKIGIVRSDEKRASDERLKEHQTGNPRPLFLHHTVQTPVVERVETLMHRVFAQHRVSGEWFKFDELLLAEAIQTATNLAKEASEYEPLFTAAKQLATKYSSDELRAPSDEVLQWFDDFLIAEQTLKQFFAADAEIRVALKDAIAQGEDPAGAKVQKEKISETFNAKRFAEENPDLHAKYLVPTTKLAQRFLYKRPKDLDAIVSKLDDKVMPLIAQILADIEQTKIGKVPSDSLHAWHLVILENIGFAEWDKEVADARLRVATGTSAGIEGVCTWHRKDSTTQKLDQDRFRDENYEMYKKYLELKQTGGGLLLDAGQAAGVHES